MLLCILDLICLVCVFKREIRAKALNAFKLVSTKL
jgi:hypothetical protein